MVENKSLETKLSGELGIAIATSVYNSLDGYRGTLEKLRTNKGNSYISSMQSLYLDLFDATLEIARKYQIEIKLFEEWREKYEKSRC